jgi:hypothetical protein
MRKSLRRADVIAFPAPHSRSGRQHLAVVARAADAAHDRWKALFGNRQEQWLAQEVDRNLRSFGINERTPTTTETMRLAKLSWDLANRAVETRIQSRQVRIDRAAYNMRVGGPVRANRHRDFGIGLLD